MSRCPTPEQRKKATDTFLARHLNDEIISVTPVEPTGVLTCETCGYSADLPLKMIGWTCNQRGPNQTIYEGCNGTLRL